jgi:uncharacterized protein (DUF4415 family)
MAEPENVPVRDLEVADRIAKAVRGGRPADRTPTIEQVVAAFGEPEPTVDARRRASRALALAGVATVPDVMEVAPGQRLTLEVRHERKRRALVGGIAALVLLFAAVAAAATQLDFSDDPASDLPAGTASTATTATNTVTQEPTTSTDQTTSTAAKAPATAAERRRAKRIRERRAREKRAKARAAARRKRARAAARRRVTVRLDPRLATFLCVEGDGKQLFNGTLSSARSFRAKVVRLNIGLGPSTRVTANGKAVPLTASPTGLELTPKSRKVLPLGTRPCA